MWCDILLVQQEDTIIYDQHLRGYVGGHLDSLNHYAQRIHQSVIHLASPTLPLGFVPTTTTNLHSHTFRPILYCCNNPYQYDTGIK